MSACATGSTVGDTQSPYWLFINGSWVHLRGVAPEVSIEKERPRSEFISVGGYRHAQQAPRGPRTWSLSFEHATPEAVAAIQVAAEAPPGGVLLYDAAAAAANMLDPRRTYSLDETDPLLVNGLPLRTFGSVPVPVVAEEVPVQDNSLYVGLGGPSPIEPSGNGLHSGAEGVVGYRALMRFAISSTPPGATLTAAELQIEVTARESASATLEAWATDPWNWPGDPWPNDLTFPAQSTLLGSHGPYGVGPVTIPLNPALIQPYVNGTLPLEVSTLPGNGFLIFNDRTRPSPPTLRLTYTQPARDFPGTSLRLLGGRSYTMRAWTDEAQGTDLLVLSAPNGGISNLGAVEAPAGTGPRDATRVVVADPGAPILRIEQASPPGAVTGLQLTEGSQPPYAWMQGQHTSIPVEVGDPSRNRSLIHRPGALGYGTWSVEITEVAP